MWGPIPIRGFRLNHFNIIYPYCKCEEKIILNDKKEELNYE